METALKDWRCWVALCSIDLSVPLETEAERKPQEGRWWMASYHAAWSSREAEQRLREKKIHPTGLASVGLRSLRHGERQHMKFSSMCTYCLFLRTSGWECSAGGWLGAEQTLILALFQTQICCLPVVRQTPTSKTREILLKLTQK